MSTSNPHIISLLIKSKGDNFYEFLKDLKRNVYNHGSDAFVAVKCCIKNT